MLLLLIMIIIIIINYTYFVAAVPTFLIYVFMFNDI